MMAEEQRPRGEQGGEQRGGQQQGQQLEHAIVKLVRTRIIPLKIVLSYLHFSFVYNK